MNLKKVTTKVVSNFNEELDWILAKDREDLKDYLAGFLAGVGITVIVIWLL